MPKLLLMLKKNRKHAEEKLQNCTEPQKKMAQTEHLM